MGTIAEDRTISVGDGRAITGRSRFFSWPKERNMRALVCLAVLAISVTAASAPSSAQQAAKRQTYDSTLLDETARVKECMKQWDRSTHMTRKEWETTCRRVAKERVKYLREQGYGAERKKPATRGKSSQM